MLKDDFPRLPLTGNLELFRALARLGGEPTALHLLEFDERSAGFQPASFINGGRDAHPPVEKIQWSADILSASPKSGQDGRTPLGTVWLDKAQTTGFRGVSEAV